MFYKFETTLEYAVMRMFVRGDKGGENLSRALDSERVLYPASGHCLHYTNVGITTTFHGNEIGTVLERPSIHRAMTFLLRTSPESAAAVRQTSHPTGPTNTQMANSQTFFYLPMESWPDRSFLFFQLVLLTHPVLSFLFCRFGQRLSPPRALLYLYVLSLSS